MATGFDLVPRFPSTRHQQTRTTFPARRQNPAYVGAASSPPTGSQSTVRGAVWNKSTTGDNDQRPPARQLTALILHNDTFHAQRRCGRQHGQNTTPPLMSPQRDGSGSGGGESTFKLSAGSPPKECLTFAAALLPVQIHGW